MSPHPNLSAMSSLSMSAVDEATSYTPTQNSTQQTTENKPIQPSTTTPAKLISATSQSLKQCGQRLRSGSLIAFPTETVYGLGCHALDPIAVQKVFDAKERPLSDPLIVHVTNSIDALELWDASSSSSSSNKGDSPLGEQQREIEKQALSILTTQFFPGPLTIVARANPTIPQILMANTGYVACRSPSHPIARALINAAQIPIAAPSANKFGHVSPTLASHVYDDLGMEDVWIVDPTLGVDKVYNNVEDVAQYGSMDDDTAVCQVGVESTVAKIEMNTGSLQQRQQPGSTIMGSVTILRHGAISSQSIRDALQKANLLQYFHVSDSVKFTSEKEYNVAPGQTVKHYSPNVPCFMISSSRQQQSKDDKEQTQQQLNEKELDVLSQSVIIDYGKRLEQYKKYALAYRDLSSEGNPTIAASHLFETLRWSETIDGARRVFVPEIVLDKEIDDGKTAGDDDALILAVKDKLTRAASAVVVSIFQ